jgi:hypothetical protein
MTLSDFMQRMMFEGEPFEIYITLNTSTETSFTLDSTNWDWNGDGVAETTPFLNKMLLITGMSYEATIVDQDSCIFDYLTFDGIECTPINWDGRESAASEVNRWDGSEKTGTDFMWPRLSDHFGVPFLVVRQKIAAKLSTHGVGGVIVLRFRGYVLDRRY